MEEQRKEFAHETLHHTAEVTVKKELNVDFLLNHSTVSMLNEHSIMSILKRNINRLQQYMWQKRQWKKC